MRGGVLDVESCCISARRLRTTELWPRLTMEGLWEWLCKDRVEEPDSGRGLVDGAGSRLGSFFRASTTFLWLGVTSAERCSPGGSFLVGEEETDVLIERTDNA